MLHAVNLLPSPVVVLHAVCLASYVPRRVLMHDFRSFESKPDRPGVLPVMLNMAGYPAGKSACTCVPSGWKKALPILSLKPCCHFNKHVPAETPVKLKELSSSLLPRLYSRIALYLSPHLLVILAHPAMSMLPALHSFSMDLPLYIASRPNSILHKVFPHLEPGTCRGAQTDGTCGNMSLTDVSKSPSASCQQGDPTTSFDLAQGGCRDSTVPSAGIRSAQ